MYDKQPKQPN